MKLNLGKPEQKMMTIDDIDEIIEYSFGLSMYLLFSNLKDQNDNVCLDSVKENFFQVIEYLLKQKKIMLVTPGADIYQTQEHIPKLNIYDKEAQWDVSPEDAVQYFRERWPKNLKDSNDVELTYYLYEMPGIIWIADDGSLYAS